LRATAIELGWLCRFASEGPSQGHLACERRAGTEIRDNLNEKPDLYAAAICTKVRSDHLAAGLPLVCSVPAVCRTARTC